MNPHSIIVSGLSEAKILALRRLFYRMWGTDPAHLTAEEIAAGGPGRPTEADFNRVLDEIVSRNDASFQSRIVVIPKPP